MSAMPSRWNDADRQAFRDGQRLRAQTIPGHHLSGPDAHEWDDWAMGNGPVCENADSAFLPTGIDPGPCSPDCPVHGAEALTWDETPDGDQDSTLWPDEDLWFELLKDR